MSDEVKVMQDGQESVEDMEQEDIVLTLIDEQGNSYDATLLTTFQAGEDKQDYAAFLSHVPDKDGSIPRPDFPLQADRPGRGRGNGD